MKWSLKQRDQRLYHRNDEARFLYPIEAGEVNKCEKHLQHFIAISIASIKTAFKDVIIQRNEVKFSWTSLLFPTTVFKNIIISKKASQF